MLKNPLTLTRRSLLGAMLAASCGPAIVRVASLMPVRPLAAQSLASSMAVDFDVANLSYTAEELETPTRIVTLDSWWCVTKDPVTGKVVVTQDASQRPARPQP